MECSQRVEYRAHSHHPQEKKSHGASLVVEEALDEPHSFRVAVYIYLIFNLLAKHSAHTHSQRSGSRGYLEFYWKRVYEISTIFQHTYTHTHTEPAARAPELTIFSHTSLLLVSIRATEAAVLSLDQKQAAYIVMSSSGDTGIESGMQNLHIDAGKKAGIELLAPHGYAELLQDLSVFPQLRMFKIQIPHDYNALLQDLSVFPQLRMFKVKIGDASVLRSKEHVYLTLQDILHDLKILQDPQDRDALIERLSKISPNPGWAAAMAQTLPKYQQGMCQISHATIGRLISQLSSNAVECLRAEMPLKDMEDAWDAKLRDMNNSFLVPH